MAAALLKDRFDDVDADSAGIATGDVTSRFAIAALEERGVTLSQTRAKQIDARLASKADVVIAMARRQAETLKEMFAEEEGKIFSMSDVIGEDIPDPYGKWTDAYRLCCDKLFEATPKIYEFIKKRV